MNGWAEAMMMYENAFYDMRPNELEDYNKVFTRVFDQDVAEEKLIWHRDKKDRIVNIVHNTGWRFQKDNELPQEIPEGTTISISRYVYHRLIKGDGPLIVEIHESDN